MRMVCDLILLSVTITTLVFRENITADQMNITTDQMNITTDQMASKLTFQIQVSNMIMAILIV